MNRKDILKSLASGDVVDLVVVGGGATGLGVALDAARRGYRVVLLESHDFAGGTSSRSTKLLHGGVRYLAQGNVALVREALHERRAILKMAPHLAAPLSFVMPSYAWWQVPFYGIGLKLYDMLAGKAGLGRTQWLTRAQAATHLPSLSARGLHGGVMYWDAQFDDARLALAVARSAEQSGARLVNYTRVERLVPLTGQVDGAAWSVASCANAVMVDQSPLRRAVSTMLTGVSQEPPTMATLGSAKNSFMLVSETPPVGQKRTSDSGPPMALSMPSPPACDAGNSFMRL